MSGVVAGGGVVESEASAAAREDARELSGAGVVEVERWRRKGEGGVAAAAPAPVAGDGRRRRRRWRRHILEWLRSGGVGRVWEALLLVGLSTLRGVNAPRATSSADLRSDGQDGKL